jgi:8-oxo-dGTP pyrophosphatase MutT (NUDIX family)
MDFNEFSKYTSKIAKETLPFIQAHAKMAPFERLDILKNTNLAYNNSKKAAVMMLFYPKGNETHLVLIKRNSYPGVHSSQIAFPGGKVEHHDLDLIQTALRETHEEIGIHPSKIEIIKPFSEVYIPPSNFLVHPYMGISYQELDFNLQPEEVAGIIELPVSQFLDDKNIIIKKMDTSYAKSIEVPCFKVDEHYIWGATAMMMSELKEVLKKVL